MSDDADGRRLRVQGARKSDAGRGIARIPDHVQRDLGVLSGDPVVLEGDRLTVAKVWPGSGDGDVVRIDADTRASAGVTVGDAVTVRGASVTEAGQVRLQPADEHTDASISRTSLRTQLVDRLLRTGKRLHVEGYGPFVVTETDPNGSVRVTGNTTIEVDSTVAENVPDPDPGEAPEGGEEPDAADQMGATYEDIGGLDEELELVREMIELPLSEPELFSRLGVDPPRGVLLHGPPGTGKTLIARAVANEVEAHFDTISGPEIVSKYKGESEQRLRQAFETAAENAPAILFIDEIDSIAAARDEEGDMENRVVAQLLTLMDGLESSERVIVVGATNRIDVVDPALRRGGRFDREIEIGAPDEIGRREILEVHTRDMPLAEDVSLADLASRSHGFVGADLASLAKEAAMSALRRDREHLEVTREDFENALAAVEPSAMREHVAERPMVTFEDVGGLADVKDRLRETVEWPLSYGPLFDAASIDPPTGILLYGPPGTGKTLLARAIAGETGVNFISVAGPELLDRYVGETEEAIRDVFDQASQTAPTIVFFDEIDGIANRRGEGHEVTERVVSQLLTELDRAADDPRLVVIAATNRRDVIDPALLRPGRFETELEVPLPDSAGRSEIFDVHLVDKPLGPDVDVAALAEEARGRSGAEIEAVVRDAGMRAIREVAAEVDPEDAPDHAGDVTIERAHLEAALDEVDEDR